MLKNNCAPFMMGADPELFIRQKSTGHIVDSSTVVPLEGKLTGMGGKVTRDGVQVEFHPSPGQCMTTFSMSMKGCFKTILDLCGTDFQPDFTQTVELSEEEMEALPPSSKQLGCQPSLNIYGDRPLNVTPNCARRSAGGHIHIGWTEAYGGQRGPLYQRRQDIVPLLDVLLGVPCVLIDRDEKAHLRREIYGRAGEFRLPSHGLEYRTLSNFWLRSFPLTNFVMQQARFAARVAAASMDEQKLKTYDYMGNPVYTTVPAAANYAGLLLSLVDLEEVQEAINRNDREIALRILTQITPWIEEHCSPVDYSPYGYSHPLGGEKLKDFLFLAEKGLDIFFPEDPCMWWGTKMVHREANDPLLDMKLGILNDEFHARGWECFCLETLRPARKREEQAKADALALTRTLETLVPVDNLTLTERIFL